jgi:hypothetical protein
MACGRALAIEPQMGLVRVLLQFRQEGSQRRLRVPDKAVVDLGAPAELFPTEIDLDDGRVFGEKLVVGKVRSDHEQQVAVHHGVIAGRKSQQTGHSYVKGVVVLDELLPAHGMHDSPAEPLIRKPHDPQIPS